MNTDEFTITYPILFPLLYHEKIIGMFVVNGDGTRHITYDADTKPSMKLRPVDERMLMLLPVGHPEHPYTTKKLIKQIGAATFNENSRVDPERQIRAAQSRLSLKRGIFIGGSRRPDGSQGIYIAITPNEALGAIETYGRQARTMMTRYEKMKKRISNGPTAQGGDLNE